VYVKEPVLIKSNRYGITIYFDPDMPYEELLEEVRRKFKSSAHFFDHADMAVEFEGRTFTKEEEQLMAETIQDAAGIQILCIVEKNTDTEEIHKRMLDESLETIHERDGQFYRGTLRGRQILESETSIVIVGDIEEGAVVASKQNVVVTGTIYGTVIAGAAGNYDAVIAASDMEPKRLRIGDIEVKPVIGGSYSWAKLL
jgi:septum site-determining protein MinC